MVERLLNDAQIVAPVFLGILIVLMAIIFLKEKTTGEDVSVALRREEALTERPLISKAPVDARVLHPVNFRRFRLVRSTQASHNTKLLRFEIPNDNPIGLPIGRHLSVMAMIDGNKVIRSYTPVSRSDETGHFELLMKRYTYGKMSSYLFNMKVGDHLDVRGPVGRFKYSVNKYRCIGLICGGTGLTPCLQVLREILEGVDASREETKLVMLYQNRTEDDILLKEQILKLHQTYPSRLNINFFLSSPPDHWGKEDVMQRRGYISIDSINSLLPCDTVDLVGLCGPSGFTESMTEKLVSAGFDKEKDLYIW